jgi:hypothetical protein
VWFRYDYAESLADGGGTPLRAFDIRIKAKFGTLESGNWLQISVANAAPAAPSISVTALPLAIQVIATLPATVTDYAGMIVWASTTPGFALIDANKIFDGVTNTATINGLTAGIPLYVRSAFYDVFGKTGLNATSEFTVTPFANSANLPIVNTLPSSGLAEGQVIYLTTDDKLYRYNGTAWVTWVDGSDILAASVTAGKITTTSLSAISVNMGTLTAGNITLDTSGFIRGGSTAYDTDTGFWLGYSSAAYKFSLGDPAGNKLTWDGTNLNIVGGGTFSGALSAATGTFAGSLSAATGTFGGSLSAATGTFAGSLSAATGTFGDLTVASGGNVKMGQTAYNTGTGFWLGDASGTAKFSLGNSTNFMRWTGTALEVSSSTNTQTFNASGTWTKPNFGTMAFVEVWGGGGGGGGGYNGGGAPSYGGGGGGGGGYSTQLFLLSGLGATVAVTVGAAAAGGVSGASATFGTDGHQSSFAASVIALGGKGGKYSSGNAPGGVAGVGGGNGGTGSSSDTTAGTAGSQGTNGGGGGGGGSGNNYSGANAAGGTSGGAGAGGAGNGGSGIAPGGGGGGGYQGTFPNNGGSGAAGRVRITVF